MIDLVRYFKKIKKNIYEKENNIKKLFYQVWMYSQVQNKKSIDLKVVPLTLIKYFILEKVINITFKIK